MVKRQLKDQATFRVLTWPKYCDCERNISATSEYFDETRKAEQTRTDGAGPCFKILDNTIVIPWHISIEVFLVDFDLAILCSDFKDLLTLTMQTSLRNDSCRFPISS